MSSTHHRRSPRSRRMLMIGGVLACAATALTACSSGGDGSPDASSDGATIGVYTTLLDYGLAMVAGAEEAAGEAGAKVLKFDPQHNPQVQLQQCQDSVTAKNQDGLLVYPMDGEVALICAKLAKDAGIPVVGVGLVPFGSDPDSNEIQTDAIAGQAVFTTKQDAEVAVSMLKKACADLDPCNVVYFQGSPNVPFSASRLGHFKELVKDEPSITVLDTVVAGLNDPDMGAATARDVLAKHADVDVFINDDDTTMSGIVRAVQDAGRGDEIKLLGDGANQLGWDNIKSGKQWGTVITMPTTWTKAGAELLLKAINGEEIEENNIDLVSLSPVGTLELTADNIDGFTPEY